MPKITFSLEGPANDDDESEKALQLISEIEDHSRRLLADQEKQKEEDFFNTWRDILRLKTLLADSDKEVVKFNSRDIIFYKSK